MDQLSGLAQMSGGRVLAVTLTLFLLLGLISRRFSGGGMYRWLLADVFALYAACAVINSFSWPFFALCLLVLGILIVYARYGWERESQTDRKPYKGSVLYPILAGVLAGAFFLFVSRWTVARIHSFCTSTFDFGIFSQMFYSMKTTGLPVTTLERNGPLSHFSVHVSPIYYLMLPFYCLFPRPETLQVLQAAVMASAVIPLWKLGKCHGLHPGLRTGLCALLLIYPAYSGGAANDLHENCFLTPLILWLLYAIDRKHVPLTAVSGVLILMVKEDAPVYVAVIGLYLLLRSRLHGDKWGVVTGGALTAGAVAYFLAVTAFLSAEGEGVMNYRYENFMYDGSDSLRTLVKAVLLCPMKAAYECVDPEKLKYIGLTLLPLVGMPLMTRRYERFVLLIPYVLVNLMSDYRYQHDIFFQYSFGSAACLFYLAAVNLADMKEQWMQPAAMGLALCISFGCFYEQILPTAESYPEYCETYAQYYADQRALLETIPEDASVASTTFHTTYLSGRSQLYDIRYCSPEQVLGCEYVVIKVSESGSLKTYAVDGEQGRENLTALLLENGYVLENQVPGVLEIYRKPAV